MRKNAMFLVQCLATIVLLLQVINGVISGQPNGLIPVTIRSSRCVINATHCSCARTSAPHERICYKALWADDDGIAEKGPLKQEHQKPVYCVQKKCAEELQCDCEANDICERRPNIEYKLIKSKVDKPKPTLISDDDFDAYGLVMCKKVERGRPFRISDKQTKFHILGPDSFALFHNHIQVGHGKGGEYNVASLEVSKSDVIGVSIKHLRNMNYGIKVKFDDLKNELRTVDTDWKCSNKFDAAWLDRKFDAVTPTWRSPVISRKTMAEHVDTSFDSNIPWMWVPHNDSKTDAIYCRYKF